MSDETKFTQADLDAAVAKAVGDLDGLKTKLAEALDEAKDAKRKLRAASEIKPEDLTAAEERADKAEAALADANKQLKAMTTERDKAVQALETESNAARTYALEAEISSAIAAGNIVPALVPAFKAMVMANAKADLVDGKYSVSIGDKAAKEYIDTYLSSDDGKAFRAANGNSGGGAGGGGGEGAAKTMVRSDFSNLAPTAQSEFIKGGGKVVDQAA